MIHFAGTSRAALFDHLIGGDEQRLRHGQAEYTGGLVIDDELELARLHDRQVGGLRTLEDAAGIGAGLTICVDKVGSVAYQATGFDKVAQRIRRGDRVARRQVDQLDTPIGKTRVEAHEDGIGAITRKSFEGLIDVAAAAGVKDLQLQSHGGQPVPSLSVWSLSSGHWPD